MTYEEASEKVLKLIQKPWITTRQVAIHIWPEKVDKRNGPDAFMRSRIKQGVQLIQNDDELAGVLSLLGQTQEVIGHEPVFSEEVQLRLDQFEQRLNQLGMVFDRVQQVEVAA